MGFVKATRVLFYPLKWSLEKKGGREASGLNINVGGAEQDNIGEGLCFRKSAL